VGDGRSYEISSKTWPLIKYLDELIYWSNSALGKVYRRPLPLTGISALMECGGCAKNRAGQIDVEEPAVQWLGITWIPSCKVFLLASAFKIVRVWKAMATHAEHTVPAGEPCYILGLFIRVICV